MPIHSGLPALRTKTPPWESPTRRRVGNRKVLVGSGQNLAIPDTFKARIGKPWQTLTGKSQTPNYFEARPYVTTWSSKSETEDVAPARTTKRVPGLGIVVEVEKRRTRQPVKRTPAMRPGIQEERRDKNGRVIMPSLLRVLYRPWLYAGTPVWDKFENPNGDRRSTNNRQNRTEDKSAPVKRRA